MFYKLKCRFLSLRFLRSLYNVFHISFSNIQQEPLSVRRYEYRPSRRPSTPRANQANASGTAQIPYSFFQPVPWFPSNASRRSISSLSAIRGKYSLVLFCFPASKIRIISYCAIPIGRFWALLSGVFDIYYAVFLIFTLKVLLPFLHKHAFIQRRFFTADKRHFQSKSMKSSV